MSAIHRIDDIESVPGPKFLRLARRITCYQGVMAARLAEELSSQQETQSPAGDEPVTSKPVPIRPGAGQEVVRMVHRAMSIRR